MLELDQKLADIFNPEAPCSRIFGHMHEFKGKPQQGCRFLKDAFQPKPEEKEEVEEEDKEVIEEEEEEKCIFCMLDYVAERGYIFNLVSTLLPMRCTTS